MTDAQHAIDYHLDAAADALYQLRGARTPRYDHPKRYALMGEIVAAVERAMELEARMVTPPAKIPLGWLEGDAGPL